MRTKGSCSACWFSNITKDEERDEVYLECRKHAPTILSGSGTGWSHQLFPKVKAEYWCGEFKSHECTHKWEIGLNGDHYFCLECSIETKREDLLF